MPANATVAGAHIWLDDRGVAWIDDANTKVIEVALDSLAHGWSPEEIHFQHPHLSLGQIHAALAFYHDHKVDLDEAIQAQFRDHRKRRTEASESPIRKRLRDLGKLP